MRQARHDTAGAGLLRYSPRFWRDASHALRVRPGEFRVLGSDDPAHLDPFIRTLAPLPMNGDITSRDLETEVTVVHEQDDVKHRRLLLVLAPVEVREINPFGRHKRRAVEV